MIQNRGDQVAPAEGPRRRIFPEIGRGPRLEQLLQRPIGAKFRILTWCRRRRPSCGSCIKSPIGAFSSLERRGGSGPRGSGALVQDPESQIRVAGESEIPDPRRSTGGEWRTPRGLYPLV